MSAHQEHLITLANHLGEQRELIMDAWRRKVAADPHLTTGATLPDSQLDDHLPALLQDFESRLRAGDSARRVVAEEAEQRDAAAHGLHRWQQGFDLLEVSRELGRFNECVVAALESFAATHAEMPHAPLAEARSVWAGMYSVALGSSTAQYFRLQQREAAGHVADLEQALETLRQMEVQRAELWQQVAHDLRGNLGVVSLATAGLTSAQAPDAAKAILLAALDRNVLALHRLLEDVTSLARLQSGQECRTLATLDASDLLRQIAGSVQAAAAERQLRLGTAGPEALVVEGDAIKIRRIVQNLVLNAIKYTHQGSISVEWGDNVHDGSERWFVCVSDTGPGLGAAHTTPPADRPGFLHAGEGIGLSIVRRLCALLDATMEVESRAGQGTSFRVVLPRRYAAETPKPPKPPPAPELPPAPARA
jgi:signal transduction histidine kinase